MPITLIAYQWVSGFARWTVRSTRAAIFEIQTALIKCTEKVEFYDEVVHGNAVTQTKSDNYTMTPDDSGKITYVDTDAKTMTLPSTVLGLTYTFVNAGADAGVLLKVAPAAADQIVGNDFTEADNKAAQNTKTTAKTGDLLQIIGDGSLGWYIQKVHGTWAREA